jgi:hypothetical protein
LTAMLIKEVRDGEGAIVLRIFHWEWTPRHQGSA